MRDRRASLAAVFSLCAGRAAGCARAPASATNAHARVHDAMAAACAKLDPPAAVAANHQQFAILSDDNPARGQSEFELGLAYYCLGLYAETLATLDPHAVAPAVAGRGEREIDRDVRFIQDRRVRAVYVPGMRVLFIAGFSPIVRDASAARAFYADGLGLEFEGGVGDYVFTEKLAGAKHFGVWPLTEAAEACFGRPDWPADVPAPQATIEFEVDDVAEAAATLERRGHRLIHPARTEPWKQTIARLLTPDGLLVGVCHTPWLR